LNTPEGLRAGLVALLGLFKKPVPAALAAPPEPKKPKAEGRKPKAAGRAKKTKIAKITKTAQRGRKARR
jgi:hypothetical protein